MSARNSFHAVAALVRIVAVVLVQGGLVACSPELDQAVSQAVSADAPRASAAPAPDAAATAPAAPGAPARFAIRAQRGARLDEGASVSGGDVGVASPSAAWKGHLLKLDSHAAATGGARLIAPSVFLARGAVAGEVLTDRLYDRGSTHGPVSAFVAVPPVDPLPAVAPGAGAVTASRKHGRTLAAGGYGRVVVEPDGVLRLAGGDYALASLHIAPGGAVLALAPARVRIATRLDAGSRSRLAIADGAGTARDLRVEVAGADSSRRDRHGDDHDRPAARLGARSTLRALVSAPEGLLVVGPRASVAGALVARAVRIGARATVAFEDGFEGEPACPAGCDDGNPCTSDACVAGACRHEPAPAGLSCADANACNGLETCDGQGACAAGVPLAIDDGNPCTADLCDAATGVLHPPLAAGATCSDADACNGLEACDGQGTCVPGGAPVVDDGDPCTADACDPLAGVSHTPIAGCPAPPPEPPFASEVEHLWGGDHPVQSGVQPGAIDRMRVAVVRGTVLLRGGGPLADVRVDVFDHPELGSTLTRADGGFELAVNGGGQVVLQYAKEGHPVVHRAMDVPASAYTEAPDVALVRFDVFVTPIQANVVWAQIARGGRGVDASGTRQVTMVFQPFTAATMTFPDGSTVPLVTSQVRATEYTVGPTGAQALPAELPPSSVYQYDVELSVDDAVLAGAQEMTFDPPVAVFVDEYRGFAVGQRLPVTFYDRSIAAWLPQEDGRVIAIVGVTAGAADLDVDGDGAADEAALPALGVTRAERERLAALYPVPGKRLWRIPVGRFGPTHVDRP